jgi:hypothetical protein
MAYFQTKNPNLGKFWRDLRFILLLFGIFFSVLVCWYAPRKNLATLLITRTHMLLPALVSKAENLEEKDKGRPSN